MFPLFRPACTVEPLTRAWIDDRWRWLTGQFGAARLASAPDVLPTPEFFPDQYARSPAGVRRLVDRVCSWMEVDAARVDLEFFSNTRQPYLVNDDGHAIATAAGTMQRSGDRFLIRLEQSQQDRPLSLVGTVAHELAHVRLLGEGRLTGHEFDHELLTDLAVVFHGLGLFLANSPRHWRSQISTWPGTQALRPEYMTTPMYGHALALRCHARGQALPAWKRYLVPGVRAEFKQAYRFLAAEAARSSGT